MIETTDQMISESWVDLIQARNTKLPSLPSHSVKIQEHGPALPIGVPNWSIENPWDWNDLNMDKPSLVGGWAPPLWKMMKFVSWGYDIPNMMGKTKTCSKPPTSKYG